MDHQQQIEPETMRDATQNQQMEETSNVHPPAVEKLTDKEQHNVEASEIAQEDDEQQQDAQEQDEQATLAANRQPVDQENGLEKDKGAKATDEQNARQMTTSQRENEGKLAICYFFYF